MAERNQLRLCQMCGKNETKDNISKWCHTCYEKRMNEVKRIKYAHSFARVLLQANNIEVKYSGQRTLLLPPFDNMRKFYEKIFSKYTSKLTPYIITNTILNPEPILTIEDTSILRNIHQLVIKKRTFSKMIRRSLYSNSKMEYYLDEFDKLDADYEKNMPRGHLVVCDTRVKQYVIKGPHSDGFVFDKNKPLSDDYDIAGRKRADFSLVPNYGDEQIEYKIKLREGDIPIGICRETSELICLPKRNDANIVAFIGKRGSGKTTGLGSYMSLMYHLNGIKCVYLNDWDDESVTWCQPNDNKTHKSFLDKIGLSSRPMPMVFVTPYNSNKDKISYYYKEEKVNLFMTLKWSRFIKEYFEITKSYGDMALGATGTHLDYNQLSKMTTIDELNDYINILFPGENKDSKRMRARVESRLGTFFDLKLLDISTDIPADLDISWKDNSGKLMRREKMPTIPGLMYLGLVPSLRTSSLSALGIGRSNMLPVYFNFLVKELYDFKVSNKHFEKDEILIGIDELATVIERGEVQKSVDEIATLGRHKRIGCAIAQQNYTGQKGLIESIKTNINYLFVFKTDIEEEIKAMCKDIGASESIKNQIKNLKIINGLIEAFIFPFTPYVTYDLMNGHRSEGVREIKKIIIMPPLCQTKKPGFVAEG